MNGARATVTFVTVFMFLVWALPAYAQDEEMPAEETSPTEITVVEIVVPVEVPAPTPTTQIAVDSPTEGANVRLGERLAITGWAADPAGPSTGVSVVYVYLDAPADQGGVRLDEADYGKARPDVARAWGRSDWTNTGFELSWVVGGIAPGRHTLYIYAHSIAFNESTYQTVNFTVLAGPAVAQPTGPQPSIGGGAIPAGSPNALLRIISPTSSDTLSGTRNFTIVAVDCSTGTPARSVRIASGSASGTELATTSTPSASRDLSQFCPGRSGSANIEFQLSVNTSSVGNGIRTFVAVADIAGSSVTANVSAEVSNGGGGSGGVLGGTGTQSYNTYQNCAQNPYQAGCTGTGTGTYLYNTPCTGSNYNCNPNYPNNYGCVVGSVYPCTNSSTYGTGTGTYLYNTPCSGTNYNCNPNYPNNYGCVVGGLYPCTNSSIYGTGTGTYLYNTPCTGTNYNCNPNYPNNYGCVAGGLYPCTNSSLYGGGIRQYLYNTPCSTAGNYNCNPSYPNNYGCVVGGLYPCR